MQPFKYDFGVTVKDTITEFEGIVTGALQYISGCSQYLVQGKIGKDGEKKEPHWIDEQRLELVAGKKKIVLDNSKTPGPDAPAPKR